MDGQRRKPTGAEVGAAANPKVGTMDMGMIPTATDTQRVPDLEIPTQDTHLIGEAHRAHDSVSAGHGKVELVT